jgi:hypothetical protein
MVRAAWDLGSYQFRILEPPMHGHADIDRSTAFPRFPDDSPFAVCNTSPVQGVAVTYTPAKGFTGEDFFAFAEAGQAGSDTIFKMSLTVR